MVNQGDLVIFRTPHQMPQEEVDRLINAAERVTARLRQGIDTDVVLHDGIVAYRLEPGQSTEMLDAEAERIRNG